MHFAGSRYPALKVDKVKTPGLKRWRETVSSQKVHAFRRNYERARSKTHKRLMRTLFNWTKQDKTCFLFFGSRVYACLGVTCHLHSLQTDRGLLRATAVTRGWKGHWIRVSTQLTLEKKIISPLLSGFELATFRSRVRRPYQQAIRWFKPCTEFGATGATN